MIGRFTGAILGLLAFSASIFAGLMVENPFTLVLSRAIWALCVFFVIGLVVGAAAQRVVNEYAARRLEERLPKPAGSDKEVERSTDNSTQPQTKPMGT